MGLIYLTATVVLNAIFIGLSLQLRKTPQVRIAWDLFRFSIYFLALLFIAAAADVLLRF